jgi:membrane-bound lytic murein transglycosylase B
MMKYIFALLLSFTLCSASFASTKTPQPLTKQTNVQQYIQYMVRHHHFKRADLVKWFNTVHIIQKTRAHSVSGNIVHRMKHQHTFSPWFLYRSFFINSGRIKPGVIYWQKNKKWLDKATKIYGVPQEIILATIGVESRYGEQTGAFPVFKALATLAFQYPKRNNYFARQLTAYLLYTRNNHISPLKIHGSYAGAIGQPQFMPENIPAYGVDFNHNGTVNLITCPADAIGSVAKFYQINHWKKGTPIAVPAVLKGKKAQAFFQSHRNKKIKMTLQQLAQHNIYPKNKVRNSHPSDIVTLITLQEKNHTISHWIAFHNFFVLENYNNSTNYAMSLFQLSQLLRQHYEHANSGATHHAKTKRSH